MKKLILVFISTILSFSASIAQGAWPQAKNEGYFKLNQSGIVADQLYALNGDIIDNRTTSVYISSLYGEYGISPRLTGVVYVPFFVRTFINEQESTINGGINPGDELNAFGDPQIGVKYAIINDGPIRLAADFILGLPFGEHVGGDSEILQSGDGEFNQQIRLIASTSFANGKAYATLLAGFNNRTTADFEYSSGTIEGATFNDEIHFGGEFGWFASKKLLVALKLYNITPLEKDGALSNMNSSLFGNNVGFFAITPEINYFITPNFGASVSIGGAVSGQNILAAPNYAFGVYYLLKDN